MPDFYDGPTVEVECDGIYIHTVYARRGSVADEIYEYGIEDDEFEVKLANSSSDEEKVTIRKHL